MKIMSASICKGDLVDDNDDILAELESTDASDSCLTKLEAVESATEYTVALDEEAREKIAEEDKWEHLEGILYRQRCERVRWEKTEGLVKFWVRVDVCDVTTAVNALSEEIDEITGRKTMADAGELYGMF